MRSRDELIQETKDLLEEEGGKELSWEEASHALSQMEGLADIFFDLYVAEKKREDRLKESPKGFVLEGRHTCAICYGTATWFDKWGMKCAHCQRAVDRKQIPGSVAKDKESWYSKYDLEQAFNLKNPALKKWIESGIIKQRVIKLENGRAHYEIFLIKDNEGFLPPKNMVESQMVATEKDGKTWHKPHPWYHFVDPFEHLKGYKILEHMKITEPDVVE